MLLLLLASVALVAYLWSARAHELVGLSVRDGQVLVVRCRIPGALLSNIRDVVSKPVVGRARGSAGAAVAAKLQPAVLAWDGTTEPPPSLVALTREFLVAVEMPDLGKRDE